MVALFMVARIMIPRIMIPRIMIAPPSKKTGMNAKRSSLQETNTPCLLEGLYGGKAYRF